MGFCRRMSALWQREVGCWGVSGAVWFGGQWAERGGGSLPALLQRPYRCQKVQVKEGWSFSFASLLFPLTVPGSSFMVPLRQDFVDQSLGKDRGQICLLCRSLSLS